MKPARRIVRKNSVDALRIVLIEGFISFRVLGKVMFKRAKKIVSSIYYRLAPWADTTSGSRRGELADILGDDQSGVAPTDRSVSGSGDPLMDKFWIEFSEADKAQKREIYLFLKRRFFKHKGEFDNVYWS